MHCEEDDQVLVSHEPRSGVFQSLGTSALLCRRKRRVSTNDGHLLRSPLKCLPSLQWQIKSENRGREKERKRDISVVISGVWVAYLQLNSPYCLNHGSFLCSNSQRTYCEVFPHIPNAEGCLQQVPLSPKTSGGACVSCSWGHYKQKDVSERQDIPDQEPLPCPPTLCLSCLACWLLSCPLRSVVLLGRCREEHCRDQAAGSQGSSKTLRGSASRPTTLPSDQAQGPVCWLCWSASIVRTDQKCVQTSSVYFLLDLVYWVSIYYGQTSNKQQAWLQAWFTITQRHKLFVTHWYDNDWVKVGPP